MMAARSISRVFIQQQRRNVQVAPAIGTKDEMRSEMFAQIEARVAVAKLAAAKEHSQEHEIEEMSLWLKISFMVMIPLSILGGFKDVFFGDHVHRKEGPEPDCLKIRSKPFAWECKDCAYFDLECWEKCRAKKKG